MNGVLLIAVMFALALANEYNPHPCQSNNHIIAYNTFVSRHVLQDSFRRGFRCDWRRYLLKYGLCNRVHQSFIEKRDQIRAVQTCNGCGRPLFNAYRGNLCVSDSAMVVYDVTLRKGWKCKVKRVVKRVKFVIVACDKIKHQCLPVHFEGSTNQRPNKHASPCRPHA